MADDEKHAGAEPEAAAPTRTVTVPARREHDGWAAVRLTLAWVCPRCGGPRGEPHATISWDGSRRLHCDGWENPCGHLDLYADVRKEAGLC
jgi:hypothetical protein